MCTVWASVGSGLRLEFKRNIITSYYIAQQCRQDKTIISNRRQYAMFGSMQATGGRWWGRSWIGHHIASLTWEKKYQHTLSHSWPHYDIDDLIQQSNDVSAIIQHQDMLRCINRDVYHIHDVWNIPIRCDALHTAKATAPSSNSTYFANKFKNKLPTSWRSRLIF